MAPHHANSVNKHSHNSTKRFGHSDEFRATCAFLCSGRAANITRQNILIGGGAYPGTF
jgi:3-oxoacyl-[acyl-carrier protein] reductase